MRKFMALTVGGLMAFSAPLATANAQQQDGLVNVAIGDITILEDVRIGIAAQIVAQICGVKVGPVAVLGRAVDRSGETTTVCEADEGTIRIMQNN
jgi:hypothetical protein